MTLDLTTEEINQILNIIAKAPYEQVFQLIGKIQQQGQAQTSSEEPVDE